jgi:hypothetical protein
VLVEVNCIESFEVEAPEGLSNDVVLFPAVEDLSTIAVNVNANMVLDALLAHAYRSAIKRKS